MKHRTWLGLLMMGALMLLSGITHAEGNCPEGYYPIGGESGQPGPQGCAPVPGYNQQQGNQQAPQPLPPNWASRWGAIATDDSPGHGSTGASVNQPTRLAAEKAALENCQSNGGTNCKVKSAYDNECIAMIAGQPGYDIFTDATQDKATQGAMHSCIKDGNTNCHAYYTACSLPVQI